MQAARTTRSRAMTVVTAAAMLVAATAASTAHAEVDWAKGLVTADGIGVANRAAPTPAAARGPARRLAEEAARKALASQLGALPVAEGGVVEARRKADRAVKERIERAVANAIVVAADPETDGSWNVKMAVPIEALRIALAGQPRAAGAATGDVGAAVIVVEGATAVKPAIGYQVGGLAAATVFVKDVPVWAKDAPRVKAKAAAAKGAIDVPAASVRGANATEATLFVIITK